MKEVEIVINLEEAEDNDSIRRSVENKNKETKIKD